MSLRKVFCGWLASLTMNLGVSREALLLPWLPPSRPQAPLTRRVRVRDSVQAHLRLYAENAHFHILIFFNVVSMLCTY